jgi:predicted metal-dependent HD superfamily phosphohydrolase
MDQAGTIRERLHADWRELASSIHVPEAGMEGAFADLAARYSDRSRFYHNLDHLDEVLTTVSHLREQASNLAAVRFAAWFHDAIYDSRASDNEERSADLAVATLSRLQVSPELTTAVRRLILLTKQHRAAPDERDGQVLLDADLAILGASPERYAAYSRAIHQEYAWVPEEQYRTGRRQVLEGFLRRERLYYLDAMYIALETQARRNLADEIDALS